MRFMLKFVMNTCFVAVGEARGKLPQLQGNFRNPAHLFGAGFEKGLASESIICAVMQGV